MVTKIKIPKFSEKKFKNINEELALYFLNNYKLPKHFDFIHFDTFFKHIFHQTIDVATDLSTELLNNIFLYINILIEHNYFDKYAYSEQHLYTTLFETYLETHHNKVDKNILLSNLYTLYQKCETSYEKHYYRNDGIKIPLPLRFYKLLDNPQYEDLIKEFLMTYKCNLLIEDTMNMMEVLENANFSHNPFILKLFEYNEPVIEHLIKNDDIPVMLLEICVRDKNQELIEYLVKKYNQFIQYDDTFQILCQVKDIDVTFLGSIFNKIREEKYEKIPLFVDDENGINYLIHKGNAQLTISYMNMVQLQNFSNYISQAIEKKMFTFVDYIYNSIKNIDASYFESPYFLKKLEHTTLFYNETDYIELNTILAKYNIPLKTNDFNFTNHSEDVCQICLEEESETETKCRLLSCAHCKKAFHINCIFEYMKSKQKEIIEAQDEELANNAEVVIDINQYYAGEDDTESMEEDDTESIEEEEEYEDIEEERSNSNEVTNKVEETKEDGEDANTVGDEDDEVSNDGYIGTVPILSSEKMDDVMVIYSKMYKNLKCVHCRGSFC